MAKDELKCAKSQPTYLGPYKVIRRNMGGAYILEDNAGNTIHRAPSALKHVLRTDDATHVHKYNATMILDHRCQEGHFEYLVKWVCDDSNVQPKDKWIPQDHFEYEAIVNKYWAEKERIYQKNNPPILKLPISVIPMIKAVKRKRSAKNAKASRTELNLTT